MHGQQNIKIFSIIPSTS